MSCILTSCLTRRSSPSHFPLHPLLSTPHPTLSPLPPSPHTEVDYRGRKRKAEEEAAEEGEESTGSDSE